MYHLSLPLVLLHQHKCSESLSTSLDHDGQISVAAALAVVSEMVFSNTVKAAFDWNETP